MIDFVAARRFMVDSQVRTSDVTDLRLIAAMQALPRERFLPPGQADLAYLDFDAPAATAEAGKPARRLLKPMVLAKLLQAAEIAGGDHVLDVGCATGYSSALLARLAGSVVALEQDAGLAERARDNLSALGFGQVQVVSGPLVDGWPAQAPYDVILLNGAFEIAPKALLRQLKPGGRLVGVLGRGPLGKAMLYCSIGGECGGRPIFDAAAPLLPGFAAPAAFVF
ncbi:MAG TPA: protein-L-isoaspartate O-methyltransferase [Xanthobacteraceae bacterium]|jgi:protein-L-isoaspartate(D-aspartate) O-methyltransferase